MNEKMWCIKRCNLFSQLSPVEIQQLESRSRSRAYSAGNPIYLPTEKADSVFILASGMVKVCHLTPEGKEVILAFIEPGELFGELAIFGGQVRDEYVEAVKKSTVVMIPAEEIDQLMNNRAEVTVGITKMIGLRRQRIERRLKNLLFMSNRERIIHLLLDLAQQFGWEADEGIRLRVSLSHQDLASLIGSTRESVTVTLNQLKAEGSIEMGRRKIVLIKPNRLARSVNRQPPHTASPSSRFMPALVAG